MIQSHLKIKFPQLQSYCRICAHLRPMFAKNRTHLEPNAPINLYTRTLTAACPLLPHKKQNPRTVEPKLPLKLYTRCPYLSPPNLGKSDGIEPDSPSNIVAVLFIPRTETENREPKTVNCADAPDSRRTPARPPGWSISARKSPSRTAAGLPG